MTAPIGTEGFTESERIRAFDMDAPDEDMRGGFLVLGIVAAATLILGAFAIWGLYLAVGVWMAAQR